MHGFVPSVEAAHPPKSSEATTYEERSMSGQGVARHRAGYEGLCVSKLMFFDGGDRTLRFVEHAPADVHETEHDICGCTQNVAERPKGRPATVQPEIVLYARRPPFDINFDLTSLWLTLRLDQPLPRVEGASVPMRQELRDAFHGFEVIPHAYFIFSERKVDIEITLPGYGLTDCFFAHVFVGNRHDTTCLMNGHSQSRIVDLAKLAFDDVWVHECSVGDEVMRILPKLKPSPSMTHQSFYSELVEDMSQLRDFVRPHAQAIVVGDSPAAVLERLLKDQRTMWLAQKHIGALCDLVLDLPKRDLYEAVLSMDRELWKKQKMDAESSKA